MLITLFHRFAPRNYAGVIEMNANIVEKKFHANHIETNEMIDMKSLNKGVFWTLDIF